MPENPLDYVTLDDIIELGLTEDDIETAYQPSSGGVYHFRGEEGKGKTLLMIHMVRDLIDSGAFSTYDIVGNLSLKGKYGIGSEIKKGDDLRQFLWDLTHIPYRNKIVLIDEADSEFPARFHSDREQTEIFLRLWHTAKMNNYIFMTSHAGNSIDLIGHLATHYFIYPDEPNFETNSMDFVVVNMLQNEISEHTAYDIIKTMLIYNRQELTESTETENNIRPSLRKRNKKSKDEIIIDDSDLDISLEWEKGLSF